MNDMNELMVGRWKSSWGVMELEAQGDGFVGTWKRGTVMGERSYRSIRLHWVHADGTTGRALLTLTDDDKGLVGTWGFGHSFTDGGNWNCKKLADKKVDAKPAVKAEPVAEVVVEAKAEDVKVEAKKPAAAPKRARGDKADAKPAAKAAKGKGKAKAAAA